MILLPVMVVLEAADLACILVKTVTYLLSNIQYAFTFERNNISSFMSIKELV